MSFKNRGRKKEHVGKAMDELSHQPEFKWVKGKFVKVGSGDGYRPKKKQQDE